MAAPYHDLYENHFANIRCSRATFLGFLNYTATATAASPHAALKKLSADLQAAAQALAGSVVAREGQGATGQTLTRSKKDVLRAMRVFAQDANAVKLVPTYRQHPEKLKELLPQGLMHLTDANAEDLPSSGGGCRRRRRGPCPAAGGAALTQRQLNTSSASRPLPGIDWLAEARGSAPLGSNPGHGVAAQSVAARF
ncbi:hypothetical protein ACFST9_25555 [Hymenobacter monticola]|uniref:Uncharacterized protein n=1 Tax=Hymenobacter monticola TaxID=1705399 RepID=A0ABY4B9K4_9BACT|nr:hypothetical protein [Hymenobacter monticola]UOE34661.1 hypothetical protein MTP16_03180 [Hymenobacter monticola]